MTQGKLIVFEGPDGTGKSTICKCVEEVLQEFKLDAIIYGFPGNEPKTLGSLVYKLHHGYDNIYPPCPTALQVMHIAAHIDAIEQTLLPALSEGTHVILDRYWWSTLVYGRVSGANMKSLYNAVEAEKKCWGAINPNQIFYISRNKSLRNSDQTSEWEKLRRQYDKIFNDHKDKNTTRVNTHTNPKRWMKKLTDCIANETGLDTNLFYRSFCKSFDSTSEIKSVQAKVAEQNPLPKFFVKLSPMKPTKVFETYWIFASRRHEVFLDRLKGLLPPWTPDPIMSEYKFTNTFRVNDRVSQYLIQNVIYEGDYTWKDSFFRIMIFKIFNKISTWSMLESELGDINFQTYSQDTYDKILTAAKSRIPIFSSAYIMPSGGKNSEFSKKHLSFLSLLEKMMFENVPERIQESQNMREGFEILRSYPMIGDFLAYQYITDLNYSDHLDFQECEFVIPGPGARDGISKCFSDLGGFSESDIIRIMQDRQTVECEKIGVPTPNLWGRPMQNIDCQNVFCEVDKYSRVAHPEFAGKTGRMRIKQRFKTQGVLDTPIYPSKWNLNTKVEDWLNQKK